MDSSREKFFQQNAVMYKTHLPGNLLARLYLLDLIKKQYLVFHMDERKSLRFMLEIQNRDDFFPLVILTIKHIYPEKNTQHFLNTRLYQYSFHKKNLVSGNFTDENGDEKTFSNPSGYLFAENAMLSKQTEAHVKVIFREIDKVIELSPKTRKAKEDTACECTIF